MSAAIRLTPLPSLRWLGRVERVTATGSSQPHGPLRLNDFEPLQWLRRGTTKREMPAASVPVELRPQSYADTHTPLGGAPDQAPAERPVPTTRALLEVTPPPSATLGLEFALASIDVTTRTSGGAAAVLARVVPLGVRTLRDHRVASVAFSQAPVDLHLDLPGVTHVIRDADRLSTADLERTLTRSMAQLTESRPREAGSALVLQVTQSGSHGLAAAIRAPTANHVIVFDVGSCEDQVCVTYDDHGGSRIGVRRLLNLAVASNGAIDVNNYLAAIKGELEGLTVS